MTGRLDAVAEDQQKIVGPLQHLKTRVEEAVGGVDFPVKKTIVGQKVWFQEGENLEKVAELIIHKTLELPEIQIVKVERKSGQETGSGLIKIELQDASDVRKVLRNKRKLKQAKAKELREIFLRQSKSDEMLVSEQNQDVI